MRNWLDLPWDVTFSILSRLRPVEILESAQKVCMPWRNICKDPLMWLTIDMAIDGDYVEDMIDWDAMCRHAVDRSCGRLVDINIEHFGTDDLLKYITNSCGGIRRLRLVRCDISSVGLSEVASKLTLLEELEISLCCHFSYTSLEVVGRSCPLLKSFKLNGRGSKHTRENCPPYDRNEEALGIAGTMHGLHHLQLFGNRLSNYGLRKILAACPHLESLDLCQCFNLDLTTTLGEKIKQLRLPEHSINSYKFLDAIADDHEFFYGLTEAGRDNFDCDCDLYFGESNYDSDGNYSDDSDFWED